MVKRDKAFRLKAGKHAEDAKCISKAAHKRARKAGGYHGLDVFTDIGMDVTRQNLEDPMHIVANNMQNAFNLVMNNGNEIFTRKRRRCEVQRERFPELAVVCEGYVHMHIYVYIYINIYIYIDSVYHIA